MPTTVSGSYPAVNSDSDATINGLTVGKGGGAVASNTSVGYLALNASNSGTGENVGVGYEALKANTTGNRNTAVGLFSAGSNTTGNNNIAIGNSSFQSNTTGGNNVAVGNQALQANTTASNNTAVGYQAGYALTTGGSNTVMGYQAFDAATTAGSNTIVGNRAGGAITTGANNTIIGADAGAALTTGTSNCFIGATGTYASGEVMTTGSKNTIVGSYTGNLGGLDIRTASNYIVLSDGDGNPRQVLNGSGDLFVGKVSSNGGAAGFEYIVGGSAYAAMTNTRTDGQGDLLYINRQGSDGNLIRFAQAESIEGSITVSGTTVSYNGGHLSRWSQLPDGSKDDTILKGTVLTNLDDMCVWEKNGVVAENEQLNKMKVSDVEGDTNVAGVFVNWTIDEQYGVDDMNVAMTGDMIIRIAQGVVVQKGDLLMSAGDGTAKPQGDDIVRSKTVAKVTSNYVTCTYADGSYCVPCVLMAC